MEAAMQAAAATRERRSERELLAHERARRDAWAKAQACFAIGHEVMHTQVQIHSEDASPQFEVLAKVLASDYEARIRPIVRSLDEVDPDFDTRRDRWDSPWRAAPGTEDHMIPKAIGRNLSNEERLNWILNTPDGFGQEVMCDYGAALTVARNLSGNLLSHDECLAAVFIGMSTRMFLSMVEFRVAAYTSRVPDTLLETWSLAEQTQIRIDFMRHSLGSLCRSGVARRLRGEPEEVVRHEAEQRWRDLSDLLNRIEKVWFAPMLHMFSKGERWPLNSDGRPLLPNYPSELDLDDVRDVYRYCRDSLGVELGF